MLRHRGQYRSNPMIFSIVTVILQTYRREPLLLTSRLAALLIRSSRKSCRPMLPGSKLLSTLLNLLTNCVVIVKTASHAGIQSACCNLNSQNQSNKEKIMSKVSHIPQGHNTVTPYLIIKGAAQAIEYYKNVFGATEVMRMEQPGGKIAHAELKIGDSHIMLADENPSMGLGHTSAVTIGSSPVSLYVYLPDVDKIVERRIRRRQNSQARSRSILRRSFRIYSRSVWTSLGCGNPCGRCVAGGNGRTRQEGDAGCITQHQSVRNERRSSAALGKT